MQHAQQHRHHHLEQNAATALLAGPVALVAFAVLAIGLHDAPVAHAAHAALTAR
ncbi:hypothetical protein [Patulibacter minatonensis]|uniref:hypothetical protein n=1 Tax=Patulibacter minatonensis TaxID=298163 RepID=UPI0004BA7D17|nr:hypothetical protein [Patulibacter minatonensis]